MLVLLLFVSCTDENAFVAVIFVRNESSERVNDRNKIGRFQAAGRGTLLIDEIDVLDVKQQAKLLKIIESGEYELVGSPDALISEARLIVASNVNLQELADDGRFRLDLYYRLNVLEFRLPPLRERPNDLI